VPPQTAGIEPVIAERAGAMQSSLDAPPDTGGEVGSEGCEARLLRRPHDVKVITLLSYKGLNNTEQKQPRPRRLSSEAAERFTDRSTNYRGWRSTFPSRAADDISQVAMPEYSDASANFAGWLQRLVRWDLSFTARFLQTNAGTPGGWG